MASEVFSARETKASSQNGINRFGLGRRTSGYRVAGIDGRTRSSAVEQIEVRADNLESAYARGNSETSRRNRERIRRVRENMTWYILSRIKND